MLWVVRTTQLNRASCVSVAAAFSSQEIKECAITSMGLLLAHLASDLTTQLPEVHAELLYCANVDYFPEYRQWSCERTEFSPCTAVGGDKLFQKSRRNIGGCAPRGYGSLGLVQG